MNLSTRTTDYGWRIRRVSWGPVWDFRIRKHIYKSLDETLIYIYVGRLNLILWRGKRCRPSTSPS